MDYTKIKIPFVDREIKARVEYIRNKYSSKSVPVDIESLIEIKLGILIQPVPGFSSQCGFDAQMTSDFSLIYVDKNEYDKCTNRYRFSLAHELGHFALHKDLFNSWKIKAIDDVYDFYANIDTNEYSYLETQANKFANLRRKGQ